MTLAVLLEDLVQEVKPHVSFDGDTGAATLRLTRILIDPAEVAFYEQPRNLRDEAVAKTATLAALAAALLFPDHSAASAQATVKANDMHKLTVSVERELRGLDVRTMAPTNYLYRVNIHERFTTAQAKGATTSKILHKDNSGSEILVQGPYAPDVDSAIAALKQDLESKLQVAANSAGGRRDAGWMLAPITKAVMGVDGEEPRMPCLVWAAVNVTVVDG